MARKPKFILTEAILNQGIVGRVAAQAIANAVQVVLQNDTLVLDNGITYDFTNDWFTIPNDGTYLIHGVVQYVVSAAIHTKGVLFFVNGVLTLSGYVPNANVAGGNNGNCSGLLYLLQGDQVQMKVYQNSGGALNTAVVGVMSQFSIASVFDAGL